MLQPEHSGRVSEQFVQSALDALSAHIAILDGTGKIIGVNTAWRRFGEDNDYEHRAFGLGENYLDICERSIGRNSREAPLVATGIRQVMTREREDFLLEYPCHSPHEKRWFVMQVTRFAWQGQERLIIAHQNITELKQVQIELHDSKKRIQAILDNVVNGIITLDSKGYIESANRPAAAIFGTDVVNMIGEPITLLFAGAHRDMGLKDLLALLQSDVNHETSGERANGTCFPMHFALSRVQLGNRRIFTAIVQDITERKRIEAELLEKERLSIALDKERELRDLKNRFVNMMSHELRTPLASILLASDMLKLYGDKASEDEKRQYVDNIRIQVDYITDLIRDVMTISRGETQNISFMPEQVEMLDYCHNIFDEFNLLHHLTHKLTFSSKLKSLYMMADAKMIRHILNNLLSNAIKYSPDGGTISMRLSNGDRHLTIEVADEGIGIPTVDQGRLFEPFHRATNTENVQGTGLGLVITKQAVELHGGTIALHSVESVGTTVTVRLPVFYEGNVRRDE